jgi:hypothetical protein
MTQVANDELVLLTSYFNLAGGRRQDTADTFRVESSVPSTTSPDGVAALYIVTEASAGGHMGPRARRMAADAVAWEYSQYPDVPPPQRLKSALRHAHEQIAEEGDGHVAVGAGVIAVEGGSIFLAQASPAQVYVLHEGRLHSLPAIEEGGSTFSRALGSAEGPRISLFRDEITTGDVLALCSSWYARTADSDQVRLCFEAGEAEDIAEALLDLAREADVRDATVIVIEAADASALPPEDDEHDIPGFLEQVDSAVQALAGVGKMLWTELRTTPVAEQKDDTQTTDGRGAHRVSSRPSAESEPEESSSLNGSALDAERPPRRRNSFLTGRRTRSEELPEETPGESEGSYPDSIEREGEPAERPTHEQRRDRYHEFADGSTREVPAVSAADIEGHGAASSPTEPDVSPSTHSSFREQATSEFQLPLEDTAETPALSQWDDEQQVESDSPSYSDTEYRGTFPDDDVPEERPKRRLFGREPRLRRSPIRPTRSSPQSSDEPEAPAAAEMEEVNARLGAGPDMAQVVPPVQAFPDTSTEPSRIYATNKDIQAANRRPRRFGGVNRPAANDPLAGPAVIRPGLGDIDLRRPVGRSAPPAAVWAVGLVFLLLVLVAGYEWWRNRHSVVAVNPYPALVRTDIRKANVAKNPVDQDRWLAKARHNLSADRSHGDATAAIARLSTALSATTDTLHHITRVGSPTVLADFSKFPGAKPAQVAVSPGVVFVLDTGRKGVFSVTPNATSNPTEIVADGEVDNGFTVGMPWQVATDGQTALVLDTNNVLVRDLSGAKSATSLTPGAPTPRYVQMDSSDPDVYLLDPASSQVWRYPYAVSGYNPPPNMYFDTNKPDLTKAVSFVYDGTDLYILKSDGTMLKFDNQANPVSFTPHTRAPLKNPLTMYSDQGLNFLWIADPTDHRIVQIDKNGAYVRTYVSNAFGSIKSLAVGPDGNTVFLLSGSKLLSFNLVH